MRKQTYREMSVEERINFIEYAQRSGANDAQECWETEGKKPSKERIKGFAKSDFAENWALDKRLVFNEEYIDGWKKYVRDTVKSFAVEIKEEKLIKFAKKHDVEYTIADSGDIHVVYMTIEKYYNTKKYFKYIAIL